MRVPRAARAAAILTTLMATLPLLTTARADDTASAAAVRRELSRQYQSHDQAFGTQEEAAFLRAMKRFYLPGFTTRSHQGKLGTRAEWLRERAASASVGTRRFPANTGGFRTVEQRTVQAETTIEKLTFSGAAATVETTERIATTMVGRSAADEPRARTHAVFTTHARDYWAKTREGWRIKRREILNESATSSILAEDSSAARAAAASERS